MYTATHLSYNCSPVKIFAFYLVASLSIYDVALLRRSVHQQSRVDLFISFF